LLSAQCQVEEHSHATDTPACMNTGMNQRKKNEHEEEQRQSPKCHRVTKATHMGCETEMIASMNEAICGTNVQLIIVISKQISLHGKAKQISKQTILYARRT